MGSVTDLAQFRSRKKTDSDRKKTSLMVSDLDGHVTRESSSADFGDRIQKVRTALDKINSLMGDLKRMAKEGGEPRRSDDRDKRK
jgi:hypothetical protein